MHLRQFCKIGQYYNHYYEKFPEAIKLKCGYDLHYVIKYVLFKKNEQLQLQVSIICHVNNIFGTRCLSPMYCANLAKTSHTHRSIINVCLKNLIIYMILLFVVV